MACNLKIKNYTDALSAVNQVIELDPKNRIALQRRAKAISRPVNANVEDYLKAIEDLRNSGEQDPKTVKEIARL